MNDRLKLMPLFLFFQGIRNAGIAVAVGTWSSIIVLTSFVFGIIIFQERVKDFTQTCFAFAFLILGLVGMSRYSAHQPEKDDHYMSSSLRKSISKLPPMAGPIKRTHSGSNGIDNPLGVVATTGLVPLEMEPLVMADDEAMIMGVEHDIDVKNRSNKDRLIFFGARVSLTRRQLGILGAVVNGAWGGMNLIPLHYAMRYDGITGAGYLISYATGSLIVNTAIWILLFAYYLYQKKGQWEDALECLPKWHLDQLLLPGLAAGLLYSLGNFSSIIAVTYLGQGTGFSFCQMQLLVSGLWGVFYFREIKGIETISKWFASAAIAVTGIIWLSYQHEGGTAAHR